MKVAYWIISVTLLITMIVAMVLYDSMTIREYDKERRLYVFDKASQIKTNLQSALNSNLILLNGLSSVVHANPAISTREFHSFAEHLLTHNTSIRNVSIIPGTVIRDVYPLQGNESAIGLDLAQVQEQARDIDYIRETGNNMVSGPLTLVQGGIGIIGRTPIFIESETGVREFWGSVSLVIDFEKLIKHAQFNQFNQSLKIALRGKQGMGANGDMMFGDDSVYRSDPVLLDIQLPQGSWQIAAIPREGWSKLPPNIWLSRLVSLTVLLLILTIALLIARYNRDRKQSISSLKREKYFSSAVLNTVGTVITVLNRQGLIIRFNKAAEELTGFTFEDLEYKPIWNYLIPNDQVEAVQGVFKQLKAGNFPSKYENHWKTRDGSKRLISWSNTALTDNDDNVEYVIATGIDITDQRKAELEREQLQHQLLQTQKMEAIGQLTGGIAHDFNNILASILGYTELALEKYTHPGSSDKLTDYLQHVLGSAQRARELVAQMLAFSRGDDSHTNNINPVPTVQDAVHMLRSIIPTSIQMETSFDDNLPSINANSVELNQVIMNLAINSRDAMNNQGRIQIWIKHHPVNGVCTSCHEAINGQYLEIGIEDDGSGIEPELIDHIFEPFFTTKDVGKGTGMGLSMVHGIIHSWNGHILLESRTDTGTNIRLLIPAAVIKQDKSLQTTAPRLITEVKKAEHSVKNCYDIMVVDDEESIGNFLKELLEMNNFCVDYYSDPKQALTRFRQDPARYDLIITDQSMPGITGLQLIQQVAILNPDIPVILCTGYSEQIDENIVVQKTANLFIQKPLDTKQLISSIHELIEQYN